MTKYLDLLGLTIYDLAIKLYIDNSTPESITTEEIEKLFREPIPVAGIFQVFADEECTLIPSGEVTDLYVRVNRDLSASDVKEYTDGTGILHLLRLYGPTQADPNDEYSVVVFVDFRSPGSETPFVSGTVIHCVADYAIDVDGCSTIFE